VPDSGAQSEPGGGEAGAGEVEAGAGEVEEAIEADEVGEDAEIGEDGEAATVGYLGPEGTFSEEALLGSAKAAAVRPVALASIRQAVMAVQEGSVRWAVVPLENSVEGSVTVTLDTLAGEAAGVGIVGEVVLPVRHHLIAREPVELKRIETIVSHPHVPGQCTRFLSRELAHAQFVAATSTAEAVRLVSESEQLSSAAIGTELAARLYDCTILVSGIQDREDNETRFVWLARNDKTTQGPPPLRHPAGGRAGGPAGRAGGRRGPEGGRRGPEGRTGSSDKTSIVFWGAGAGRAGWLVRCLDEFAKREINLTRIESRPMRERLGQYMFYVDLEGATTDAQVAAALDGLRAMCERVRVLGSYPAA
jgi:prephenate dehydratase